MYMVYMHCEKCKDFFPISEFTYSLITSGESNDDIWNVINKNVMEYTHETCGYTTDKRPPYFALVDDAIRIEDIDLLRFTKEMFIKLIKKHPDKTLLTRTYYHKFADMKFNEFLLSDNNKFYIKLRDGTVSNIDRDRIIELLKISRLCESEFGYIEIPIEVIMNE